jgi:hypothetical protein
VISGRALGCHQDIYSRFGELRNGLSPLRIRAKREYGSMSRVPNDPEQLPDESELDDPPGEEDDVPDTRGEPDEEPDGGPDPGLAEPEG